VTEASKWGNGGMERERRGRRGDAFGIHRPHSPWVAMSPPPESEVPGQYPAGGRVAGPFLTIPPPGSFLGDPPPSGSFLNDPSGGVEGGPASGGQKGGWMEKGGWLAQAPPPPPSATDKSFSFEGRSLRTWGPVTGGNGGWSGGNTNLADRPGLKIP